MNKTLELPAAVYDALQTAAVASGTTPEGWIAAHLRYEHNGEHRKTLAELFKGKTGLFNSSSSRTISENCGELFADDLEEKHREGRL